MPEDDLWSDSENAIYNHARTMKARDRYTRPRNEVEILHRGSPFYWLTTVDYG